MTDTGRDPSPDPAGERIVVALVRGVHGLRGALRVEILTDRPERRFTPGTVLYREGTDEALTIAAAEAIQDGPGWRVRFHEIATREAADRLRAAYLEAVIRPDADLGRGEVYWHEVIGVPVRGLDGQELGVVRDVYRVAENEVYVVADGPYGTFDLPAVRAFIRIFAPRRGEIVIDAAALDLQPPRDRAAGDRPRAPRRTSSKGRGARKAVASVDEPSAEADEPSAVAETPGSPDATEPGAAGS